MNKIPESQILIIFGASGDLTHRKLIPSLFELFERKLLPDKFLIVGVSRTKQSTEEFRQSLHSSIIGNGKTYATDNPYLKNFLREIYYISCDTTDCNAYVALFREIEQLRNAAGIEDNMLFYLATPPQMYATIPICIQAQQQNISKNGWRRIIIEKPYGSNEDEAKQLDKLLCGIFPEREIYRIDHFLGKETVQNILVLRFANSIWEPLWNRNYIDHIEITATETLGVEQRGNYYDSAGALRDMVQSHLMQIMAFIAMEPPSSFETEAIRNEISKVFRSLRPLSPDDIAHNILRAQYSEGKLNGTKLPGYREEPNVNKQSTTETFVALKLYIDNWRWAHVPFYIYTGKRLSEKRSEIIIHFRSTPQALFPGQCCGDSCNQLIITLQPDESIRLRFGLKQPGTNFEVQQVSMDFFYNSLIPNKLPDAYERLLLDAMRGGALLYSRSDALELSWHYLAPLIDHWEKEKEVTLEEMDDNPEMDSWVMKETTISELVEDEKQKLLYVFDYMTERCFFIELSEIITGKNMTGAKCTKKSGEAPKQTVDFEEMAASGGSLDLDENFYGDQDFDMEDFDQEGFDIGGDAGSPYDEDKY